MNGDPIGQKIDGWEVGELLGHGGMSSVFRARSASGEEVAIKIIAPERASPRAPLRLQREIKVLTQLSHPGIVPILGAGSFPGGRPYYVMQLIEGRSLAAVMDQDPPDPRRAIELVARVARALGHAHANGVIHRDVKPSNIMVRPDGSTVVVDFGLAKVLFEDEAERLTKTGQLLGTIAYMSPEQARGSREIGPPSDVFSLGVVLCELISKNHPFHGEQTAEILAKIIEAAPPPVPGPSSLRAVVARALARDPAERFTDGDAFAVELERLLEGDRLGESSVGRALLPLGIAAAVVVVVAVAAFVRRAGETAPAASASAAPVAPAVVGAAPALAPARTVAAAPRDRVDPLAAVRDPSFPHRKKAHELLNDCAHEKDRARWPALLDHARREVEAHLAEHGDDPLGFWVRSQLALLTEDYESAARDAERAVELDPGESYYLFHRGQCLLEKAELVRLSNPEDGKRILDAAEASLAQALKLGTSAWYVKPWAHVRLAQVALARGDGAAASRALDEAIAIGRRTLPSDLKAAFLAETDELRIRIQGTRR
jgi:hypothetical protein